MRRREAITKPRVAHSHTREIIFRNTHPLTVDIHAAFQDVTNALNDLNDRLQTIEDMLLPDDDQDDDQDQDLDLAHAPHTIRTGKGTDDIDRWLRQYQ